MAINNARLTKEWIDYLKGMQFAVSSKTEPGKLEYKKKVTSDDLSHFLEAKTDFSEEQISNAVHMVLAKKAQGGPAKLQNNPTAGSGVATRPEMQQQAPKQLGSNQPRSTPVANSRYSKDNATDVEYRDIKEELRDDTAYTLDEKDVETIFSILTSGASTGTQSAELRKRGPLGKTGQQPPAQDPREVQSKKDEMRKLKRVIRDQMSPAQRKTLWRVLTDA